MLAVVLASRFAFIFWMVKNAGNGVGVANIDFARGQITLLFAVGTIAVALILTFMVAFDSGDSGNERFDRGREILALLLGIFGTILGFYFGSASRGGTSSGLLLLA